MAKKAQFKRIDVPRIHCMAQAECLDEAEDAEHALSGTSLKAIAKIVAAGSSVEQYITRERNRFEQCEEGDVELLKNFMIGDAIMNEYPSLIWDGIRLFPKEEFHFALTHLESEKGVITRERLRNLNKWTSFGAHPPFSTVASFGKAMTPTAPSEIVDEVGDWFLANRYEEFYTAWEYAGGSGGGRISVSRMYSWGALEQTFAVYGYGTGGKWKVDR